ncbi:alpha-protein kinase 3 isoform X2 [Echeneis naucrates]|uniref:alpha-protein kinase 3 isoform X2 n=1 Tax=Echeneis naucrates TaxID=173247 RepID=UPI00111421DE|nr:alpha-protein kinase 3-like isoform X2 [Echeneis naucrates]
MGSRRMTTRSTSWNGRSSSVDENGGGSRPGSCSYLSNVRPENRSTLCSVMAQLTEETQPSFQTTLKSKAVSENCNVKFSCVVTGYPAPQVNWYKDDLQLDRYCGLPKYEIFRNGQSHSLHIYNCTVEDAAIYQASAINNKGIVSCSGVLEVGEMNEFKIHQRYFAKLKQKAEHRRREAEGKENQEPLRTISPDRTQRKRRSTMEAFLSTPSSTEDEGNEESHQAAAVEIENRLQEPPAEKAEEKPVTNGQVVNENGNNIGTYVYDSAQKIFTVHQPKSPFVKKKIKISNGAKFTKADTPKDKVYEEIRAKDETPTLGALAGVVKVQSEGNSEKIMEVEKLVSSSIVDLSSQSQKLAASKYENKRAVPPQSTVPPAARAKGHGGPRSEGKQAAKYEKEAVNKETKEHLEVQKQSPFRGFKIRSTPPQSSVAPKPDESTTSTGGPLGDLKSVVEPRESGTSLPQHPCEQAEDQLPDTETRPCQENVSEPQTAPPSEVTPAHTKMTRNDAPVSLELPCEQFMMDTQPPQRTPSESVTTIDDIQTQSLHFGLQAAIDIMTQDTWDHSRGSTKSHTALFTDLRKSPLKNSGNGDNTQGCNVSPAPLQSQIDTAIKTVEGMEIQLDQEAEGKEVGKLLGDNQSMAPSEKIVEMEIETAAIHEIEETKSGTIRDAEHKDAAAVIVQATRKEKPNSKVGEESCSELQNLKPDECETVVPQLRNNPENTKNIEQIIEFNEIPAPVSKVISVAELLRSQIRALDPTLANSLRTTPVHVQEPTTTAAESCQDLRRDERKCKLDVKKSAPGGETETIIDNAPPTSRRSTVTSHLLNKTEQEQSQTQDTTSPPVQTIPKAPVIEDTGVHSMAEKYEEGVVDIGQETGTSYLVPSYRQTVSLTDSEMDKFLLSTIKDEETKTSTSVSNLSVTVSQESVTPIKASSEKSNTTILDQPVEGKDMESTQKLTPEIKFNSKIESVSEINSTTLLEQLKMEEHETNAVQKCPVQSVFSTETEELQLIQQDNVAVSRSDSSTSPTLETSPLSKKRNCVSPIPSATPQELASGARRKILTSKAKPKEATEATSPVDSQALKKEAYSQSTKLSTSPVTPSVSPNLSRRSLLQPPSEQTSPVERRSPLLSRRKAAPETQAPSLQQTEEINALKTEGKPAEKDKHNPFKAPQVIRKIRAETFADASGHLKLWCQFFNVLSDSTIKWYKDEKEVAQIKRNAGDEAQVNLAIVQASYRDSGVYSCSITNEYGTDSTDTLLSAEILAGMSLHEDLAIGEEIEMTPMIFSKGVADSGMWANKLFGRIMMQESHIGDGCSNKVWRAKVIYGLEPVFESGNTCIIKVRNPIAYGGKEESCLMERNLDIIKQECKTQNLAREYCKIFSAEARVIENFGPCLEC